MPSGLTTDAAEAYLKAHGYNEIVEHKDSLLRKIFKRSATPISGMLLLAAILSYVTGKGFDGSFILALLVLNVFITVWQERKADTAIEKLNQHLAVSVRVLRDGQWKTLSARLLAPHDVVELSLGSVVPADATVLEATGANINEAALTGESLPKEKHPGDTAYSGSFVTSGTLKAEITATGNRTYFGKTLSKIEVGHKRSALESDILRISRFLSVLSLIAVAFLTWILFVHHAAWVEIVRLDLSLVIAGIPISLPTVMTLIIAFGVIALAKKEVVVRRLSSLEELANTNLLLTDKTGTLTQNKITVHDAVAYGSFDKDALNRYAGAVALEDKDASINQAILTAAGAAVARAEVKIFTPADSTRKRSTVVGTLEGKVQTVALGAPQVVAGLCDLDEAAKSKFDGDVEAFAKRGYRTLALARAEGEKEEHMQLMGLFALSDILRQDAKDVIQFLGENGIGVVMLTGDNRAIAKEIADELSIPGASVIAREHQTAQDWEALTAADFARAQAFAEILPEDKYELVKSAKRFYTVAVNGDGVNDVPAVKGASVGFAVQSAVDALKGAADIVLLSEGISVMRDAFIEGRKIFARLYSYSLYRISESFRLIITIAVLGLFTGTYPLSPLQLILIALLNDIPIISLAFDRVRIAKSPSKINVKKQFSTGLLYGVVGIANSLLLYGFAVHYAHLSLPVVQTLFFLKLSISGQLLIFVAHTEDPWYRFLPSKQVIYAIGGTQVISTALALTGFLMPAPASWPLVLFVWVWSFGFMQITEVCKQLHRRYERHKVEAAAIKGAAVN